MKINFCCVCPQKAHILAQVAPRYLYSLHQPVTHLKKSLTEFLILIFLLSSKEKTEKMVNIYFFKIQNSSMTQPENEPCLLEYCCIRQTSENGSELNYI